MVAHHHMEKKRIALGYYRTGKYGSADISVFCSTLFHGAHLKSKKTLENLLITKRLWCPEQGH